MSNCPKCGALLSLPTDNFCPVCDPPLLSLEGTRAPEATSSRIPWESVASLGVVRAVVQTVGQCLFCPSAFFARLSPGHSAIMPFAFALVVGSAGSVAGFLWSYFFFSNFPSLLPWGAFDSASASGAGLILVPVLIAVKIVFESAYFHALLVLTRSNRRGFASTVDIVCYAESTAVFNLIPVVGGVVSALWSLYVITQGFCRIHGMSFARTLLTIFLPLIILGFFGILAVALVGGAVALFAKGL